MTGLNSTAKALKEKYVRQSSDNSYSDTRKKRGLQAEINKIEAIHRVIISNNIDDSELMRMRTSLNKLVASIDEIIMSSFPTIRGTGE